MKTLNIIHYGDNKQLISKGNNTYEVFFFKVLKDNIRAASFLFKAKIKRRLAINEHYSKCGNS